MPRFHFPDRIWSRNSKILNFNLNMIDTYIFDIPIQRNFLYKNAFSINVSVFILPENVRTGIFRIKRPKFEFFYVKSLLNHLNKRLETGFSWKCPLLKIFECLPAGLDVKWSFKDKNSPFSDSSAFSYSSTKQRFCEYYY